MEVNGKPGERNTIKFNHKSHNILLYSPYIANNPYVIILIITKQFYPITEKTSSIADQRIYKLLSTYSRKPIGSFRSGAKLEDNHVGLS